jgi:hypothetical protein
MPEEPQVVMPAVTVSVVIVSASVMPSVAVSVFIVVLSLSTSSRCLLFAAMSAVTVARRRRLLLSSWSMTCPLVAVVSAIAVPLTAAALCCRRVNNPSLVVMPKVKAQRLYKNDNTRNEEMERSPDCQNLG